MLAVGVRRRRRRPGADHAADLLARWCNAEEAARFNGRSEQVTGGGVIGRPTGPAEAVDLALSLIRHGDCEVGIGLGADDRVTLRRARDALDQARAAYRHVTVLGDDPSLAQDAEALLRLLAAVVERRSHQGWEVVDLVATGLTQRAAARELSVTPQAVSQRLHAAWWQEERQGRLLAGRLLTAAGA